MKLASGVATRADSSSRLRDWIVTIPVGVYFLLLWKLPLLPAADLKWHVALGLGATSFALTTVFGIRVRWRSLKTYWAIVGLGTAGASVSVLNAADSDLALYNTFALGVNYVIYTLFIPALVRRRTRWVLLFLLVLSGLIWSLELRQLVQKYGSLLYSTMAETRGDKNFVGVCYVMAGTTLVAVAVYWGGIRKDVVRFGRFLRPLLFLGGGVMWFNTALIYARSGLVAIMLTVAALFFLQVTERRWKLSTAFMLAIVVAIGLMALSWAIPAVGRLSPQWSKIYSMTMQEGAGAYIHREILLRKGLYIIGDNFLVGIGLGGSRAPIGEYPGYLIHNTYLTEWAEKGILGILAMCVWILSFWSLTTRQFLQMSVTDRAWMVLMVPLFVEMAFLDMTSLSTFVLCVMVAIGYDVGRFPRRASQVRAASPRLMGPRKCCSERRFPRDGSPAAI